MKKDLIFRVWNERPFNLHEVVSVVYKNVVYENSAYISDWDVHERRKGAGR